jgi:hypothetical protein
MVMCNLDYAPVRQSLGSSSRVQHLRLFAHSYGSEDHQFKDLLGGFAHNRSIKSLGIICTASQSATVFRGLLPLFENNTCLESLELSVFFRSNDSDDYSSVEAVHKAIMACQSLKSIVLLSKSDGKLKSLLQVICNSKHLKHLNFRVDSFSKDGCIHIKNLLSMRNVN